MDKNNSHNGTPSNDQVTDGFLQAAGITEINQATREAAQNTIAELQQLGGDDNALLNRAKSIGMNVDGFLSNQQAKKAEIARLNKELTQMQENAEDLMVRMEKGVRTAGITALIAGIAGAVISIFKVKGKEYGSLKNTGIVSASAILPAAIVGFVTKLFTYNPKKSEAVELSEKIEGPKQAKTELLKAVDNDSAKFRQDFAFSLLKHHISTYAQRQHAEAEKLADKQAEQEKQQKPAETPAKKIINKAMSMAGGGHEARENNRKAEKVKQSHVNSVPTAV